jgi:hypothetical protein
MIRPVRLLVYPAALLCLISLAACAPQTAPATAPAVTQTAPLSTLTNTPAIPVMGVGITSLPSLTVPAPAAINPAATSANVNTGGPQRIQFAPGSTLATLSGQLVPAGSAQYILYAQAGQTMSIHLAFTTGQAILVVWGKDGNVLLSDHAEASDFQMSLPTSQDYNIQVKGSPTVNTAYQMTVDIPATGTGSQRIQFPAGSNSITVSGQLPAYGSDQYVLNASAGQTMKIDLTFSEGQAILVVWGADGDVLLSDHAEVSSFQGSLPKTQDYNITVKGRPEGNTMYRMTITIPPLP